jgi:hypothetical protein
LNGTTVALRKLVNKIIEGSAQIVTNLADQDAEEQRRLQHRVLYDYLARVLRIELNNNGVFVLLSE